MNNERFRAKVAVGLLLKKGDEILMLRRSNSVNDSGQYSLIAGHLEKDESVLSAICREAEEEAGIKVDPQDLTFVHAMQRQSAEYLDVYFVTESWEGEPYIAEPEKCSDMRWFDIGDLPHDTQPFVSRVIAYCQQGIFYSEL